MKGLSESSQQVLDSLRPINVITDIRNEMTSLEQWYPDLMGNLKYLALKDELLLIEADNGNIDFNFIEKFYKHLVSFLRTAEIDNKVVSFRNHRIKNKPALDGFLPATFDEFVSKISLEKQAVDYLDDGIEAAAHSLILGELPYGLTAVVPRFRDAVRAVLFDEIDSIVTSVDLTAVEEDQLLSILELREDQIVEELMDGETMEVAIAVLEVRREVEGSYSSSKKVEVSEGSDGKKVTKEELERLRTEDVGAYRLLRTVAFSKIEDPKSTRLNLAARVARVMKGKN
ncbi:MAG: hypothetical protein NTZ25_02295 [Candidatus Peregrinibacteria bacterium]|nr:hypothetical protein [Candidatus Peregrinibacteria bacterium]